MRTAKIRVVVVVVSRRGSGDSNVLKRALYDGVAGGDDVRECGVLPCCVSAAVQASNQRTGNALVRCLGRQSPQASQRKSQLG
jgi:hypothetical protein